MRILAVSDPHGKPEVLDRLRRRAGAERPDVVVAAGDITGLFRPGPVIQTLDRLGVPVLAVRGNSDRPRVDALLDAGRQTESLHLRVREVAGVRFVGVGGTLPLPFRTRIAFREQALLDRVAALGTRETVLVAHPPPWGVLDEVGGRFHAGSKGLADLVQTRRPALLICGHIHERPGWASLGETVVVNATAGWRGDAAARIDWELGRPPEVTLLRGEEP
jgi:hypothetical protein